MNAKKIEKSVLLNLFSIIEKEPDGIKFISLIEKSLFSGKVVEEIIKLNIEYFQFEHKENLKLNECIIKKSEKGKEMYSILINMLTEKIITHL